MAPQLPAFRTFPPETREMIFEMSLPWDGRTPALLAALRVDEQLYKEALHIFCKINTYSLAHQNERSRRFPMSDTALQSIKRIKIDIAKLRRQFTRTNLIDFCLKSLEKTFRGRGLFTEARISLNLAIAYDLSARRGSAPWILDKKIVKTILAESIIVQKLSFAFSMAPAIAAPDKMEQYIKAAIIEDSLDIQEGRIIATEEDGMGVVTWTAGDGKVLRWRNT